MTETTLHKLEALLGSFDWKISRDEANSMETTVISDLLGKV